MPYKYYLKKYKLHHNYGILMNTVVFTTISNYYEIDFYIF